MAVIALDVVAALLVLGLLALVSHFGTSFYGPKRSEGFCIGGAAGAMVVYEPGSPEAPILVYLDKAGVGGDITDCSILLAADFIG